MGVFGGIMISPLSHLRSLSRLRGRDGEGVSPQFGFSGVSAPLPEGERAKSAASQPIVLD
jgi:hypothetical protein